jgi:predicted glycogen debranching enzyme
MSAQIEVNMSNKNLIQFTKETLMDLGAAMSREWLETNGLGGFSSSTIIGVNTRRYHGLLTAATKPPVGRMVLLSKLEETLLLDGTRFDLSSNKYPGVIHPQGFQYQTGFRLDPFPVFTFEVEGIRIDKSVFMVQGENTVVVQYQFIKEDSPRPKSRSKKKIRSTEVSSKADRVLKFEIRPLIAFRDYHSLTHENEALNSHVDTEDGLATVQPYGDLPALNFAHDNCEIDTSGYWYRNFEYAVERERGLDFNEDLFCPCSLTFDLNRLSRVCIIASTERCKVRRAYQYRAEEKTRRQALARAGLPALAVRPTTASAGTTSLIRSLITAADQFIVSRASGKTIIAGYHWFSDWGRDTMIALPGLTLVTGNPEIAKSILAEFSKHVDQGMLPNRFPDAGEAPEYNTVDASLWFFEAVRSLLQYTNDYEFVRAQVYDTLTDIIAWHVKGTRYNIHVDTDGLLFAGEPGVQLTWMDAKVDEWVVTPRHGKPVEIQALWYNALCVMEHLAQNLGQKANRKQYQAMAKQARMSFNRLFWNEEAGCLYDVVNGDTRDASIRPNQILAISLANSLVSKTRAKSILAVAERELLTPRGLRTLSPGDPQYRGRYEGDASARDGAYHQGAVWPWLMGPYITAYGKTFGKVAGRKLVTEWLNNFHPHLEEAGLGQVSEIFDGDPPHTPRGCIAQAWSVAELLRAAFEDA